MKLYRRLGGSSNTAAQSALIQAERARAVSARLKRKPALTIPDLVLLSLLAERPMHGYQAILELDRREVQDWAEISRPLVYYSLEKLARGGLIQASAKDKPEGGRAHTTYQTTERGVTALADALEWEEWTTQRERPPFLTWMALSWKARPGIFLKQLKHRRKFLLKELAREKKTALAIYQEVGHKYHEAMWMVGLMIAQFRAEILWSKRLERDLKRRRAANSPVFSVGLPQ